MIPRNITHNFLVGNYGGSNGAIDKCVIATRDSGAPLRPFTCDASDLLCRHLTHCTRRRLATLVARQ